MLTFNPTEAAQADRVSSQITETGKYIGVITRAGADVALLGGYAAGGGAERQESGGLRELGELRHIRYAVPPRVVGAE